jgi:hypothetical protein
MLVGRAAPPKLRPCDYSRVELKLNNGRKVVKIQRTFKVM